MESQELDVFFHKEKTKKKKKKKSFNWDDQLSALDMISGSCFSEADES